MISKMTEERRALALAEIAIEGLLRFAGAASHGYCSEDKYYEARCKAADFSEAYKKLK